MTRRELTQAVVEAAKNVTQVAVGGFGNGVLEVSRHKFCTLSDLLKALDACTEPDLDALDAAVVQAVEEYVIAHPLTMDKEHQLSRWVSAINAINARRAALKPKPRYEAAPAGIRDNHTFQTYTLEYVAHLLNERKP
jgi:hypothetical protein